MGWSDAWLSPGEKLLSTTLFQESGNITFQIWDPITGEVVYSRENAAPEALIYIFLRDNSLMVTANNDGTICGE
jgi:hypothetical protein